uniref:Serine/threonine-protein kinase mTOR (Trinotate prediction) n=1 Tax=Myxobolus squamalis TaxID=59785 RepID=A0A6B2G2I4_MYXSQ
MSMVGYILGLGDRHPSNIMQERTTGKIIHIDFGDCFEVAMKRSSFPEKVPFRLTRMLTKCMEVTGIDGSFKVTSIRVMEVLRENKDSLLAVLEAFIYDPLLNWRLLENKNIEEEEYHPLPSEMDKPNIMNSEEMTDSSKYLKFPFSSDSKSYHSQPEILNKKAVDVINRVKDKLTGRDFHKDKIVDVKSQVELLIHQATSIENLSQSYMGWCPFW